MVTPRNKPFIYVTWLPNYLIGENLCRWSIWHRIYYNYEKAKSDFDAARHQLKHTSLRDRVMKDLIAQGYQVFPEIDVTVFGQIATLKGRVDIVACRQDKYLIVEVKTGTQKQSDKIQLMLYLWALPKTNSRFRGITFEGLLVYPHCEIEISSLEVDETFLTHFQQFTKDILSSEPDRKYPSPRECKWCQIAKCDERDNCETVNQDVEEEKLFEYVSDFF